MSLIPIDTPRGTFKGQDSRLCSISQYRYVYSRQDYATEAQSSDSITLALALGDVTGDFVVGDVIYYAVLPTFVQQDFYIVTSVSFAISRTRISVSPSSGITPDTGVSYLNLLSGGRADYQALITVYQEGFFIKAKTFFYQPYNNGDLIIDLKAIVKAYAKNSGGIALPIVRHQEFYGGSLQGSESGSTPVEVMLSKRQLGQLGGANMWEYLPTEIADGFLGKTLAVFKSPSVWEGYNRSISVVRDVTYQTRTGFSNIGFKYTPLNINKVASGAEIQGALYTGTDVVIWTEIIPPAALTDAYVRVEVTPGIGIVTTGLAEAVDFRVQKPCRNPLYLEYLSRNGAYEQYMFEIAQEVVNDSELGDVFDIPITDDIGNTPKTIGRENITENQRLVVTAETLDVNTLRGLRDIKSSEEVFIYLNPTGSQKIAVRVVSQRQTQYSTGAYGKAYDLTIEFEIPENFDYFDESEKTP